MYEYRLETTEHNKSDTIDTYIIFIFKWSKSRFAVDGIAPLSTMTV